MPLSSPYRLRRAALVLALGTAALMPAGALAQAFPTRAIHIISTTSPGGVNDTISRAYAQQIAQALGQPAVVENRPGAGSIIGMSALAKSPADGYTVAVTTPEPVVFNPFLYTRLPYDAEKDFAPVSQLSHNSGIIVGSASLPANTFREVVAYAKTNPGKLNFATWGPGSTPAIFAAWINRQNGIEIQAIAYKGAVPSVGALLSGDVQLTYQSVGYVLGNIKAGKLKAIALTGSKRPPVLPGVAMLSEFGSDPGIDTFFGVFAPGATPGALVERLGLEFARATRTPAVQNVLAKLVFQPVGSTPAEFADTLRSLRRSAAEVVKALDIRPTDAPE